MKSQELSFEYILKQDNNWLLFKELYRTELSNDTIHEIEKMLKCRISAGGFATYLCPECGSKKRIPLNQCPNIPAVGNLRRCDGLGFMLGVRGQNTKKLFPF